MAHAHTETERLVGDTTDRHLTYSAARAAPPTAPAGAASAPGTFPQAGGEKRVRGEKMPTSLGPPEPNEAAATRSTLWEEELKGREKDALQWLLRRVPSHRPGRRCLCAPDPVSNTLPAPGNWESPLGLFRTRGVSPAREGRLSPGPFTELRALLCSQIEPLQQTLH